MNLNSSFRKSLVSPSNHRKQNSNSNFLWKLLKSHLLACGCWTSRVPDTREKMRCGVCADDFTTNKSWRFLAGRESCAINGCHATKRKKIWSSWILVVGLNVCAEKNYSLKKQGIVRDDGWSPITNSSLECLVSPSPEMKFESSVEVLYRNFICWLVRPSKLERTGQRRGNAVRCLLTADDITKNVVGD